MRFDFDAYAKCFPADQEVKYEPAQEKTCEQYNDGDTETVTEAEDIALAEDADDSDDSSDPEDDTGEGVPDGRDSQPDT